MRKWCVDCSQWVLSCHTRLGIVRCVFDLRDIRQALHDGCRKDELIARIAAEQWGMVSRGQLLAAGIGREAIAHRRRTGRLYLVYRGVYAVGHTALTRRGRLMAAVLASGPGAVLSGGSAAALWELRESFPSVIEVTAPTDRRPLPGVRRRRIPLPLDETDTRYGIPVTTVARTLLDRAASLDRLALERELEQAEVRRYADVAHLGILLDRHSRAPGRAKLVAIRADDLQARNATKSALERRFLRFLTDRGLPRPAVNAPVEGFEVDGVWRDGRLVVELDSRRHHGTGPAFDRDRSKWRALQAAGWSFVPITWRHLRDEPDALESDLRRLLGR